jgi:hypothetical protein
MRQDLLEGEINHTSKTHSHLQILLPSNVLQQVEPTNLNQDRAHNVIRLQWKYTKHGRHSNLFVLGWQTTSELTQVTTTHEMLPQVATQHKPSHTNSTQVFHYVVVFNY